MNKVMKQLYEALVLASEHLNYCGYGDSWERECAKEENLEVKIDNAIEAYKKEKKR